VLRVVVTIIVEPLAEKVSHRCEGEWKPLDKVSRSSGSGRSMLILGHV
jgi:hypothetical protein